jgi:hypothetical protein
MTYSVSPVIDVATHRPAGSMNAKTRHAPQVSKLKTMHFGTPGKGRNSEPVCGFRFAVWYPGYWSAKLLAKTNKHVRANE